MSAYHLVVLVLCVPATVYGLWCGWRHRTPPAQMGPMFDPRRALSPGARRALWGAMPPLNRPRTRSQEGTR